MKGPGIAYLMFHELQVQGRSLCNSEPGYAHYAVEKDSFRENLRWLAQEKLRAMSVTQALQDAGSPRRGVAITFDDGCETDWVVAAPALMEFGFNATFFVIAGFLGRSGYLTRTQLRQLSDSGFEIGSHSMSHAYLDQLAPAQLEFELIESKRRLEDVTGAEVAHFSCPNGVWSRAVVQRARQAGYQSVATSRVGVNYRYSDPFKLARIAIHRDTKSSEFARICHGEDLLRRRGVQLLYSIAQRMLGMPRYSRLRALVFRRSGVTRSRELQ